MHLVLGSRNEFFYNFLLSFRNIFNTNTLMIAAPLTTAVDNSIHIACQSFVQNCLGPKMLLPRSSLMQKRRPCTATLLLNLFREHTIFTYIGDCFNAPCFRWSPSSFLYFVFNLDSVDNSKRICLTLEGFAEIISPLPNIKTLNRLQF